MTDFELVELEQKHLTAIFNKNQDILALHTQVKKATEDAGRLNESLKEQLEIQRQELISANKLLAIMSGNEEKVIKKLAELGYEYTDIVK